jgi:hypothetical protein
MLLIKAKAREYVEDADFKMGINPTDEKKIEVRNNVYVENAKLEKAELDDISRFGITDDTTCYWLTSEAKNNWGLDNMELADDERYLIKFDEENLTVEVYNTNGYNGKYSLTEIEQIEE